MSPESQSLPLAPDIFAEEPRAETNRVWYALNAPDLIFPDKLSPEELDAQMEKLSYKYKIYVISYRGLFKDRMVRKRTETEAVCLKLFAPFDIAPHLIGSFRCDVGQAEEDKDQLVTARGYMPGRIISSGEISKSPKKLLLPLMKTLAIQHQKGVIALEGREVELPTIPEVFHGVDPLNPESTTKAFTFLKDSIPQLKSSPELQKAISQIISLQEQVKKVNKTAAKSIEGSPFTICHNDVLPLNLVYRPDKRVAIIDWEWSTVGPRSWSVAYEQLLCPAGEYNPDTYVKADNDLFMKLYNKACCLEQGMAPLSSAETAVAPHLALLRTLAWATCWVEMAKIADEPEKNRITGIIQAKARFIKSTLKFIENEELSSL